MVTAYFDGVTEYHLSEIQLLVTKPGCSSQFFHVDNAARGVTVIVALTDVDHEIGPTRLLTGSHMLWTLEGEFIGLAEIWRQFSQSSIAVVDAVLAPGSAVVFDSRTIHRGLQNESSRTRTMLVLRWDLDERPPPGVGMFGTFATKHVGRLIEWVVGTV